VTPREKISLLALALRTETAVSVVIGTYLAVAKAEKNSHTETLEKKITFYLDIEPEEKFPKEIPIDFVKFSSA